MNFDLDGFMFLGSLCGAAGLAYGIPLVRRWERAWPSERYVLYALTILGAIFFVCSVLG